MFYSELFPNFLRARGLSITIAVFGLINILYLQVAPTVSEFLKNARLPDE